MLGIQAEDGAQSASLVEALEAYANLHSFEVDRCAMLSQLWQKSSDLAMAAPSCSGRAITAVEQVAYDLLAARCC